MVQPCLDRLAELPREDPRRQMAACVRGRTWLRKAFAAADLASPEVKLPLYSYIAARGAACRTRLGGQSGEALGLPTAMCPNQQQA